MAVNIQHNQGKNIMRTVNHCCNRRLLTALSISVLLLTGCASTSDLDAIRAMAEQAQQDASSAQQTATEARSIAEESMRMSQASDERLNRMFRRSMMK